jgi:glycosyltransferase involved in cell wall biosynthesis
VHKILHLIPTLSGGGAERQLSMLAVEQSLRGMSVHVGIRRGGVYEAILRESGVEINFLGDYKGIHPLLLFRINKLIKQIKPDIIQTWLPQMDIVGAIAAIWSSVVFIISERTSYLGYTEIKKQAWLRCFLARYAGAVVANSTSGVDYWHKITSTKFQVYKIANAIDVDSIRRAVSNSKEIPALNNYKYEILVVGRYSIEKATDTVIQSIGLVPKIHNIHVTFIGEGPLRDEMENRINESGLNDRITLLPYSSSWWEKLKSASALISMSRYEGQPNVVIETMTAGCPLIVSDIPAHREFLDEESAMLVPLDNAAVLAEAIVSLLSDPGSASQRTLKAMSYAEDLTIELAADAYESTYTEVTKGIV